MTDEPMVVHDVLVVDADAATRERICAWLDVDPALRTVSAVATVDEAVRFVMERALDVVVLGDDHAAGTCGDNAARIRRATNNLLRIVVFSDSVEWAQAVPSVDIALPKEAIIQLRGAVRQVARVAVPMVTCTSCGVGVPLPKAVIDLRAGGRVLECPACGNLLRLPTA